ncbi:acyltransferase [Paraburkholderia sp. D15]|uniref:acyltransferase family protein n=1 Tax=Paraburkholderia sp. D15 TaxID=2880218 RepID=UPI002478A006|nr:acyltransferase [Paraburkholderia sp. D15]WGS51152.1 acyltransferase [Paraburkholderia sp. D15]
MVTALAIAFIFGSAVLLAVPLGWLFKVHLLPGRYTHLDGMRAMAALMVVCAHYLPHAGMVIDRPVDNALGLTFGAVGVQIFFCITGFLFTRKAMNGPVDVNALMSSRVRRIMPLYLVAMTLGITLTIYIARSVPGAPAATVREVVSVYAFGFVAPRMPSVAGMSVGGQLGQIWTLGWEWWFYALVPFMAALLARPWWVMAALAVIVASLVATFDGSLLPGAFFLPGIVCALLEKRVRPAGTTRVVLTMIGVFAFVVSLSLDAPIYGLKQMALCTIGFPALLFGHRALLSIKPLRLLGEVSFSIYMLHLIVVSIFWVFVQVWSDASAYRTPREKLPMAMLFLAGLFVLSFVSYVVVERPFVGRSKGGNGGVVSAARPG